MAVTITLELTDEIAQRAQAAAQRTGRSLAAVLAEWLGQVAALDAAGLAPGMTYPVLTPYDQDAAARVPLAALDADAATRPPVGQR